jgi:hypothetical protein
MFARITTFSFAPDRSPHWELELRHRLWLRQMDGFLGIYFFIDRKSGKAIFISLWESEQAMSKTEEAVKPLRKEMAGGLAASIVEVGHYEVGALIEQERRERKLVEQELRVARSIQHASLPEEVPQLEGWQISPYYQPGRWEETSTTSSN